MGDHSRLGFGLQLVTVRYLGTFLTDPLDVPAGVAGYLAEQLGIEDASCVKRYAERDKTRLEHAWEIQRERELRDFAAARDDLTTWIFARAWTTGEGPKAIFDGSVSWLREHNVLLPGVSVLARLVASVRDEAAQRLWETLYDLMTAEQHRVLDALLEVPGTARTCEFDRLRKGPTKQSGAELVKALDRIAQIAALNIDSIDLAAVPERRIIELGRYGLAGKTPALKRHPVRRRLATMLAAVHHLESKATDDALELLDVLMATKLLARAQREADQITLKRYPRFARASATLAAAIEVLFEVTEYGEEISLEQLWESIEAIVPRSQLAAAVAAVTDNAPPPDADPDGEWRAAMAAQIGTVRGFVKILTEVIRFGTTAEGEPVLAAMKALPGILAFKSRKHSATLAPAKMIDEKLVTGGWRRLVYRAGAPEGMVDKAAYVFCVLEKFHRQLRRRDIYAETSSRWRDPRARLLDGQRWQEAKPKALTALRLPEDPGELLAVHAALLDETYRDVGSRITADTDVTVDAEGRLHVKKLDAVPDPPSLVDLRNRVQAMLPRVDLPEVILEVMAWHPDFAQAFTSVSGGQTRLADLHVTIAAALTAHSLNVGYAPVIHQGVPALQRDRLSHVDQHYLRAETYSAANKPLIEAQALLPLARSWGGGLVAAIDGMRFVVPVPTIHARPNPRFFGRRRGAQWLNMINDQAVGLGAIVVAGTPRDSLHTVDVIYSQDGGKRPEVIITDTGSYSDIVFALIHLLGMSYRPQLGDLPDQKLWRTDPAAGYGPLTTAARGRIDLGAIRRHWPDILRIVASVHTGAVRCHDVIKMISRDGYPTPLGNALAHYGRIFKSLHVLTYVDDEPYRRDIKLMRNLNEGRHDLARHVFHGSKGELRQKYHAGMEDQLGALGLVLNCITLWNTVYLDAALEQLRTQDYQVIEADAARLSPYVRKHINVHGHYSFVLPDLAGRRRDLRDPGQGDDDE